LSPACSTNGKSDAIGIMAFIDFLNDKQRDPRLNEILHPYYNERRVTQIIEEYEPDKENRLRRKSPKLLLFFYHEIDFLRPKRY
jgi:hypothetical protein